MPDSAIRPVDLIIGKSLLTAESIMQELRERLLALPYFGYLTQEQLIQAARNILTEYEPLVAENLANADLAAWIVGFDRVAAKLPDFAKDRFAPFWRRPPNDPPRLPPLIGGAAGDDGEELRFPIIERAAASLFDRQILTPSEYYAAESRERSKAFTVARESREDVLGRIRDRLAETVDEGASLKIFRDKIGPELEQSFIGPAHLELVYRQGVQSAFRDGHDKLADNPIVDEIFPYCEILPIMDARGRKTHQSLAHTGIDGTGAYRRDDRAFWALFNPPIEWNCRCGKNLLTIEAAARKGVGEAAEWLRTGRKPALESRLPFIKWRPDPSYTQQVAA